jgi:hypothetical protein
LAADEHQGSFAFDLWDVVHNIEMTGFVHTFDSERMVARLRDGGHNDRRV